MYLSFVNVHFEDVNEALRFYKPKYADLADNLSDFGVIEVRRTLLTLEPLLDLGDLRSTVTQGQFVCLDRNLVRHHSGVFCIIHRARQGRLVNLLLFGGI